MRLEQLRSRTVILIILYGGNYDVLRGSDSTALRVRGDHARLEDL
jgi:hypothetical protein